MISNVRFIADISSNHCGSLSKAKELVYLAKESGADYAKFQYWETDKFISKERFEKLKIGHQANWNQSVYDTYKKYEIPADWIPILYDECNKVGIEFLLSCYEISKIDEFDKYVKAWKIGSGDIDYLPMLEKIASKKKPVFLGCGASNYLEIEKAIEIIDTNLILLKCNTNYSSNDKENYKYLNLIQIKKCNYCYSCDEAYYYKGISDHTKLDSVITASIALGVEYIERHFKLDNNDSPDNSFSLNPVEWKHMIEIAQETVDILGNEKQEIQENEKETKIIQRRSKMDWKRPDCIVVEGEC